jgi:hypothetical protein
MSEGKKQQIWIAREQRREQLRAKWDNKDPMNDEERIEALVLCFGMPRDRAINEVKELWRNELGGAYRIDAKK